MQYLHPQKFTSIEGFEQELEDLGQEQKVCAYNLLFICIIKHLCRVTLNPLVAEKHIDEDLIKHRRIL